MTASIGLVVAGLSLSAVVGGLSEKNISFVYGGIERQAILHVPTRTQINDYPLIFNWHGYLATAAIEANYTGDQSLNMSFSDWADHYGYVVIYPQGVNNSFNAGWCCEPASTLEVDDVGFARALLAVAQQFISIDPDRIFSTGMSNGGDMSYRLACEASDMIRAIAPVSGTLGNIMDFQFGDTEENSELYFECKALKHPMPILAIHGLNDQISPFAGAANSRQGVEATLEWFQNLNGNDGTWANSFDNSSTGALDGPCSCSNAISHLNGNNMTLCQIVNGCHAWPGGGGKYYVEAPIIHATREIFEFFEREGRSPLHFPPNNMTTGLKRNTENISWRVIGELTAYGKEGPGEQGEQWADISSIIC